MRRDAVYLVARMYRSGLVWITGGFSTFKPYGELADGTSLLPLLTGEVDSFPGRDMIWQKRICNEARGCRNSAAMRHGVFKLLIEDDGEPQFFNLAEDPGETTDVQDRYANRFRNMSARHAEWLAALPTPNSEREENRRGGRNR